MNHNKQKLKREYKRRPLPLGIFLIRNTINDKVFLASGQNLTGIINSHKYQLQSGVHRNKLLQADWNEFGENNFAFEILEQQDPPSDPQFEIKKELSFMEDLWLAKLKPFGERGYNQPKLSREAKLRRNASKRLHRSD